MSAVKKAACQVGLHFLHLLYAAVLLCRAVSGCVCGTGINDTKAVQSVTHRICLFARYLLSPTHLHTREVHGSHKVQNTLSCRSLSLSLYLSLSLSLAHTPPSQRHHTHTHTLNTHSTHHIHRLSHIHTHTHQSKFFCRVSKLGEKVHHHAKIGWKSPLRRSICGTPISQKKFARLRRTINRHL